MIRKILIFASTAAAAWLSSYGHDAQQMHLWAIGLIWIAIVMLAQLWPAEKKKRHRRNGDTQSSQLNRSTDYAEAQ